MTTSAAADQPASIRLSSALGRWVLFATVLASGMTFLDATVVNLALPRIGREFDVGLADLQWTVSAYSLTLSAFLLLGGALGDRYGRRRLFLIGLIWFTLASALCAVAPSAPILIGSRALQGIGGALLTPGSLAIIQATFVPADRGRAIGAWSGLGGVFGAIGPLLGGFLVQAVSWRLVFVINLPLGVAAMVAARQIPDTAPHQVAGRLDVSGPTLAVLGLGGVTYGLIQGSADGWTSPPILLSLILGTGLLVGFLFNEARHPSPVLPLGVFRSRVFSGVNAATFAIYAALGTVTFLVVLQLQQVLGYSPFAAGLALLPVTLLLLAFASYTGKLAGAIGARIPMTAGPLLAAAGMAMFERATPGASFLAAILPASVAFGIGLVLTVPALTITALGALSSDRVGVASAVNNEVARVASLAAVALVPALAGLSTGGAHVVRSAFSAGFSTAIWICAGLCATGGLISWLTVPGAARPAHPAQRAAEAGGAVPR